MNHIKHRVSERIIIVGKQGIFESSMPDKAKILYFYIGSKLSNGPAEIENIESHLKLTNEEYDNYIDLLVDEGFLDYEDGNIVFKID